MKDSLYTAAERYIENGETEEAEQVIGFISDRGFMIEIEERFSAIIYNLAKVYFGEEEYAKSYDLLSSLNGYSDSEDMMVEASFLRQLSAANVWDVVTFGRFARDESGVEHEVEEIEWYVIDIRDNEYLLLSKYELGYIKEEHQFRSDTNYFWEISNTRNWLNTTFYQDAFNVVEKKYILSKTLTNDSLVLKTTDDGSFMWSINDTGNDTVDNVFILSLSEVLEICQIPSSGDVYRETVHYVEYGESYNYAKKWDSLRGRFNGSWMNWSIDGGMHYVNLGHLRTFNYDSMVNGIGFFTSNYTIYKETITGTPIVHDYINSYASVHPAIWVTINPAAE